MLNKCMDEYSCTLNIIKVLLLSEPKFVKFSISMFCNEHMSFEFLFLLFKILLEINNMAEDSFGT